MSCELQLEIHNYIHFTRLNFFLQDPGQVFFEISGKTDKISLFKSGVNWEKKQTAFKKQLYPKELTLFKTTERRHRRRSVVSYL